MATPNETEIPSASKLCRKCNSVKPTSDFYRHKRDKFQPSCKKCQAEYAIQNKESIAKRQRDYWLANQGHLSEYRATWYEEHKDEIRKKEQEKYLLDCEKKKAAAREYARKNPEKVKETSKKHYENNKDKYFEYSRNRRARKKDAKGRHSASDILEIIVAQKGKCAWCKTGIVNNRHVDHIIPLSKGGSNHRRNLQILCASCNLKKGSKDPLQFARESGRLI